MKSNPKIPAAVANAAKGDLQLAFDVGHSSIGWAVLQSKLNGKPEDIELLGCGVVTFRADDCLASSRRAYRRQRRHIRATRQRIARLKALLLQLGVMTKAELDKPGCAWPWLLAARVLKSQSNGDAKLLTWPELWDVLRWYAHNRGYDGIKAKRSVDDPLNTVNSARLGIGIKAKRPARRPGRSSHSARLGIGIKAKQRESPERV